MAALPPEPGRSDNSITAPLAQISARNREAPLQSPGCLNFEEIALALTVSDRTAKRDLGMARAWLQGELSKQP